MLRTTPTSAVGSDLSSLASTRTALAPDWTIIRRATSTWISLQPIRAAPQPIGRFINNMCLERSISQITSMPNPSEVETFQNQPPVDLVSRAYQPWIAKEKRVQSWYPTSKRLPGYEHTASKGWVQIIAACCTTGIKSMHWKWKGRPWRRMLVITIRCNLEIFSKPREPIGLRLNSNRWNKCTQGLRFWAGTKECCAIRGREQAHIARCKIQIANRHTYHLDLE